METEEQTQRPEESLERQSKELAFGWEESVAGGFLLGAVVGILGKYLADNPNVINQVFHLTTK